MKIDEVSEKSPNLEDTQFNKIREFFKFSILCCVTDVLTETGKDPPMWIPLKKKRRNKRRRKNKNLVEVITCLLS